MRNLPKLTPDTADRLQRLSYFRHGPKTLFVEDVTPSPTATRPARLAVTVAPPGGRTFLDAGDVVYLDAGDTVAQCSTRVTA